MFSRLLAVATLLSITASSFAQVMQGYLTWVSGTLASSVTVGSTPQTISLHVRSATDTFPNTFITGMPGTVLPAGTAMEFLEKGSQPFQADFSGDPNRNVPVYNPAEGRAVSFRRSVPISTSGVLSYNIATTATQSGSGLTFYLPSCYVGSLSFDNGLTLNFGAEIANYVLGTPNPNSITVSSFSFPSGSAPLNTVSFTSFGNGGLTFQGSSSGSSINVMGSMTGTVTEITSAILTFNSGA